MEIDINSIKQNWENKKNIATQANNKVQNAQSKVNNTQEFITFKEVQETPEGTKEITITEKNGEHEEALNALNAAQEEYYSAQADETAAEEEYTKAEEEAKAQEEDSKEKTETDDNHGIETTTVYDSDGNEIEKTIKDGDKTIKITNNDGTEVIQELDSEGNPTRELIYENAGKSIESYKSSTYQNELEYGNAGKSIEYHDDGSRTEVYENLDFSQKFVDQKYADGTSSKTFVYDEEGHAQVNLYDSNENIIANAYTENGKTSVQIYDDGDEGILCAFDENGNLTSALDKKNHCELRYYETGEIEAYINTQSKYEVHYNKDGEITGVINHHPDEEPEISITNEQTEKAKEIYSKAKAEEAKAKPAMESAEIFRQNIIFSQEQTPPQSIQNIIEKRGEEFMTEENVKQIIRELITTSKLTGKIENPRQNKDFKLGRDNFLTWKEIEYISTISPNKGEILKKLAEKEENVKLKEKYQLPSNAAISSDIFTGYREYYKEVFS